MTTLNLEQLKAKVAETVAANTAKVKEAAERGKLEAILKLESSPTLFNARVNLQVNAMQTQKLENLINECAEIISSTPIHNTKTRTNRVWPASHRYGYGTQVDQMYQLATGILYACQEHKALLLAHTGLNLEVLDQLVRGFGNPSYYSRNNNVIVEAKPANIELIKEALEVMQSELNVVINTAEITANNLESEFVRGETQAAKDLDLATEAISEAELEL
jgi:hypothetical protein